VLPQTGFTEDDVLRDGATASNEADRDAIDLAFLSTARESQQRSEFVLKPAVCFCDWVRLCGRRWRRLCAGRLILIHRVVESHRIIA